MIEREVSLALKTLQQGGIILYPTDTVWGIGCDATNIGAVKKIYELKNREQAKSMICLVNHLEMLKNYVQNVPESAIELIKNTENPTTIIYNNPRQIANNLIAQDNTLAIRIVNHNFCNQLIKALGKPLVSTSANISSHPSPKSFKEISEQILKNVDYVVNLPLEKCNGQPSSIIKFDEEGDIIIIRN